MITTLEIEEQLKILREQERQARDTMNLVSGAIQICEMLLEKSKQQEKEGASHIVACSEPTKEEA